MEGRKHAGEIVEYLFEPEKLRLADLAYYSPDFFVMLPDGSVEFHEVKGRTTRKRSDGTRVDAPWSREDAKLKIRFAAERFWWYGFAIVFPLKAGGWGRVEFGPHATKEAQITERREEMTVELEGTSIAHDQHYTVSELAKRWHLSPKLRCK